MVIAVQMDESLGFSESGMSLPIKIGRMDMTAVLQETQQRHTKDSRVGFYIGGIPIFPVHSDVLQPVSPDALLLVSADAFA